MFTVPVNEDDEYLSQICVSRSVDAVLFEVEDLVAGRLRRLGPRDKSAAIGAQFDQASIVELFLGFALVPVGISAAQH